MTKKGYILFFFVFVVLFSLLQKFLLNNKFSVSLIVFSLVAGLISIGIIYLFEKIRT